MWATLAILVGAGASVAFAQTATSSPATPEDLESAPVDVAAIEGLIADILSDPRFTEDRETLLERLMGPLYDWLERMVAFVVDAVTRAFLSVLSFLDFGILSWVGPALVVIAAIVGAMILGRRRARDIERRATIERILELGTDPRRLEELSDEAMAAGNHAESIRLRFVAGLLRLDEAGRVDFYPGLSNSIISAELSDPVFDRLADQFDRVVYGRRPATANDAAAARADWSALLGVRT
jgi:hypothetical protein